MNEFTQKQIDENIQLYMDDLQDNEGKPLGKQLMGSKNYNRYKKRITKLMIVMIATMLFTVFYIFIWAKNNHTSLTSIKNVSIGAAVIIVGIFQYLGIGTIKQRFDHLYAEAHFREDLLSLNSFFDFSIGSEQEKLYFERVLELAGIDLEYNEGENHE